MSLVLDDVTVERGGVVACHGISFALGAHDVVALLGPSGCGKTSLLRAIAGLEPLRSGTVRFEGRDLEGVPPEQRSFGVMFQDLALFPHLDVMANATYPLRIRKVARHARDRRAMDWLQRVGIDALASRRCDALSGGERQRVALVRALIAEPRLLLLDEPLGALDVRLRLRLVDELRALLADVGLPAIIVTHDHDEAFALADRVIVMRDGRIVQDSDARDLWSSPVDAWVSDFIGHPSAVDAFVADGELVTPWGQTRWDGPNRAVRLVVPRSATRLDPEGEWHGRLAAVRVQRDRYAVEVVGTDGACLTTLVDDPSEVPTSAVVRLRVRAGRLLVFDA